MKKEVKNTYYPERISNVVVESEKEYSKICYDIQSFGIENLKHCQYCPFKKVCLYHIGCSENSLSHYISDQYPKKWTTLIPLAHATNKDLRYFFDDRFDGPFNPSVFCMRDLHKRFCNKLDELTDGSVQKYYGQACGLSRSTASRNYTDGVNSIEIFLEHLNKFGIDIVDLLT